MNARILLDLSSADGVVFKCLVRFLLLVGEEKGRVGTLTKEDHGKWSAQVSQSRSLAPGRGGLAGGTPAASLSEKDRGCGGGSRPLANEDTM